MRQKVEYAIIVYFVHRQQYSILRTGIDRDRHICYVGEPRQGRWTLGKVTLRYVWDESRIL